MIAAPDWACALATCAVALGAPKLVMDVESPRLERGGIGPKAAAASVIVLCSDLPVTPRDIRNFATRLYPHRAPPVVVGGATGVPPGPVVYAYVGGKKPSAELKRCADHFPRGAGQDKTEDTIKSAHDELGGFISDAYQPKNLPYRLGNPDTLSKFGYGDGWALVVFVSLSDKATARRDALGRLFGLTPEFCERHCNELLVDPDETVR